MVHEGCTVERALVVSPHRHHLVLTIATHLIGRSRLALWLESGQNKMFSSKLMIRFESGSGLGRSGQLRVRVGRLSVD